MAETAPASLSQVQIIRSLAEALGWFEKELGWGVDPAELRHLTGRIGELYTAMITRGQMALSVNQRGYDVVSAEGSRISVKTVTSSGHVSFRKSTIREADRIVVLRLNIDEGEASIEEVVEGSVEDVLARCQDTIDGYRLSVRARSSNTVERGDLQTVAEAVTGNRRFKQLENGTIVAELDGVPIQVVKPALRDVAAAIGVSLLNGNGGAKNTRQLGADVIAALNARGEATA